VDSSTSTCEEVLEQAGPRAADRAQGSAAFTSASGSGFSFADGLGICLSGLCAIHCLLTPVVILLLPSFHFFHAYALHEFHDWFHVVLLGVLPVVALVAFVPGFLRHRDVRVFGWSIPGFAAIAMPGIAFHDNLWLSTPFMIVGSLFLIRAHVLNRHLCACCQIGHGRNHSKQSEAAKLDSATRFRRMKSSGSRLLSAPRR
jgi:hypothetical protein